MFNNSTDIHLGQGNSKAWHDYDGYMDEVVIWNTALSADEVTELYNSGDGLFAGSDAGGIRLQEILLPIIIWRKVLEHV